MIQNARCESLRSGTIEVLKETITCRVIVGCRLFDFDFYFKVMTLTHGYDTLIWEHTNTRI